jgi:hypothetical protein
MIAGDDVSGGVFWMGIFLLVLYIIYRIILKKGRR